MSTSFAADKAPRFNVDIAICAPSMPQREGSALPCSKWCERDETMNIVVGDEW